MSRLLFRSLSVSSVQFNCSVVSNSLQLHGLQHTRPPCPSPTPGVYSNYCPLSWWYHPTILSSVVPFSSCLLSFHRVFSKDSALRIRWPKYWSFSFSISPSNEHSGLTSFRMGWLDLLTVQGTLKSLLQPHSSKPSILWRSAFFMVQFSHPYMTTGKTIALIRWTPCWVFNSRFLSLMTLLLSCVLSMRGTPSAHVITAPWPCLVVSSRWDPQCYWRAFIVAQDLEHTGFHLHPPSPRVLIYSSVVYQMLTGSGVCPYFLVVVLSGNLLSSVYPISPCLSLYLMSWWWEQCWIHHHHCSLQFTEHS